MAAGPQQRKRSRVQVSLFLYSLDFHNPRYLSPRVSTVSSMAVVVPLGNAAGTFIDSRLLLDFPGLFQSFAVWSNSKQLEDSSKTPLLKTVPSKTQRPLVKEKPAFILVENRCDPAGQEVPSACTKTVVQENSDLCTSELRRMFHAMDENHDGLICAKDLCRFMGRLGQELSERDALSMLATVDHDSDGRAGFEEFCTLYKSLDGSQDCLAGQKDLVEEEDEALKDAFRLYDKNDDGYISCHELQAVLLALGLHEGKSLQSCKLMIHAVDLDGNGQVDIQEFKQMMSSDFLLR
ncbi:hypothetical protein R1sor_024799 [Riccia sorocarpa]|uniref:EF-hand domain-containing protein n=1 Tax=Riccia sorocarpa TaxID=122646 RepID=A0ABD3GRI6_9MARC